MQCLSLSSSIFDSILAITVDHYSFIVFVSNTGPTPAGILHDSDMKRFRGAEVVGGDTGGRFCCSLM